MEVTNLNDSGTGSLRACIEATGPRTCIFKVAGTITVRSRLEVQNPYLTIAGQTAPGQGITLRSDPTYTRATLSIQTHDVIIRYIRFRSGPISVDGVTADALNLVNASNVILDHISVSWGSDGVLDIAYSNNITIQWSVISEGLYRANSTKGYHSMGSLTLESTRISIHHNLFVSNNERSPRIASSSLVDVVNNVIYNMGSVPTFITSDAAPASVNYVGNYLKAGPSSSTGNFYPVAFTGSSPYSKQVYPSGNFFEGRTYANGADINAVSVSDRGNAVTTPFGTIGITILPASTAYTQVLANAGASLPGRDAVDIRIVNNVTNGTGTFIGDPGEVGGWPNLATGTAYTDTDRDGMPNSFETLHGFNPNDPSDRNGDADGDGYTNLEEFLNNTPPR